MELTLGHYLAFLGAALAVIGGGIGSSIAVAKCGQAVAGVVAEAPDRFRKIFVLQLLPATQGLYGLLVSFLIFNQIGALSALKVVSEAQGMALIVASLPVCIVGLVSALYQGKVAVSAINLIGKRPEVNAISMVAVVETYAIFALLMSALMVLLGVKII